MNLATFILDFIASPQAMFSTQLISTMVLLLLPIFTTLNPYAKSPSSWRFTPEYVVKMAFFYSLLPLFGYLIFQATTTASTTTLLKTQAFTATWDLCFDKFTIGFTPIALFVSWSIVQFSGWYMHADPNYNRFMKYLLVFLCAMIVLVSAGHLFPFFIGWEGVGIMSFLLIGWWGARANANISALHAVKANRIGDAGLIIALAWTAMNLGSWEMADLLVLANNKDMTFPLMCFILAATGKSAQFGLHPWLPAAMEGPTPVSALLHSSTMVVAGIFLLIRISPLLGTNSWALTICMWLGAVTSLYAATYATVQNDIKKIIAYSTTSQLGLMMVAIGLAEPHLAFLHMCTHAFFKAMLFLCAGTIIHALKDEQDIRKMGGMFKIMPITSSCFMIGNLALAGTPFLAGFFSKDAIIESLTTSPVNSFALMLTLIATSFTAVYSIRMIFYVVLGQTRISVLSPIDERDPRVVGPILRLAWGSIAAGLFISTALAPLTIPVLTLPLSYKLAALLVSIAGLLIALDLTSYATNFWPVPGQGKQLKTVHQGLSFYPTMHFLISLAELLVHSIMNKFWAEKIGPKAIPEANKIPISTMRKLQRGYIKTYVAIFLLTAAFVLFIFA